VRIVDQEEQPFPLQSLKSCYFDIK